MIIEPRMSPGFYKTYQILAPTHSHFRRATCDEVGCLKLRNGFKVVVDENTDLGRRQAYYMRHDKSRKAVESRNAAGLTEFLFVAGNKCFAEHKTRLERPELFYVRDGDRRGNPRGTAPRLHKNAAEWEEDFSEHQDRLNNALERG